MRSPRRSRRHPPLFIWREPNLYPGCLLRCARWTSANYAQPNHDLFEQTLMEISTPSHPRYGKHLKRHELKDLIKPGAESTDSVLDWLEVSGVPSDDVVNDGEWINFVATVSTAEKMLDTTFKTYQSLVREDVKKIRALHYSVPNYVREHIDMIQPTTRFGQIRPQISHIIDKEAVSDMTAEAAVNSTCGTNITPQCLKDLYNFADYKPGNASVTVGITGYLEQYARFADFAQFAKLFAPWAVGSNFTWTSVNGEFRAISDYAVNNRKQAANSIKHRETTVLRPTWMSSMWLVLLRLM